MMHILGGDSPISRIIIAIKIMRFWGVMACSPFNFQSFFQQIVFQ